MVFNGQLVWFLTSLNYSSSFFSALHFPFKFSLFYYNYTKRLKRLAWHHRSLEWVTSYSTVQKNESKVLHSATELTDNLWRPTVYCKGIFFSKSLWISLSTLKHFFWNLWKLEPNRLEPKLVAWSKIRF